MKQTRCKQQYSCRHNFKKGEHEMKKISLSKPKKSLVISTAFVETYGGDDCGGGLCGYDM